MFQEKTADMENKGVNFPMEIVIVLILDKQLLLLS